MRARISLALFAFAIALGGGLEASSQTPSSSSASTEASGSTAVPTGRKSTDWMPTLSAALMAERQVMLTSPTPGVRPICKASTNPAAYVGREAYALLLPGKDGWLFRSKRDVPSAVPVSAENVESFKRLQAVLKARGTELVLVLQPNRLYLSREFIDRSNPKLADSDPRNQLLVHNATVRRLRGAGLLVADGMSAMYDPSIPRLQPETPLFWAADHHWRPPAARYTALAVSRVMRKSPEFAAVPKKTFFTTQKGTTQIMQTFNIGLEQVCGDQALPTESPLYETSSQDSASSSLLDGEQPRVVLVGTSFSRYPGRDPFNFSGFLSEFTGADIQNEAISGGGFESAIQAYLLSDAYRDFKPSFLLWEFGHHGMPGPTSVEFNWILGAALGDCKAAPVKSRRLARGEQTLIRFRPGEDRPDRVVIENTAGDLRLFHVRVRYASGEERIFPFDAGRWLAAPAKVILKLPEGGGLVAEIALAPDQLVSGTVNAHACYGNEQNSSTLIDRLAQWARSLFATFNV